MKSYRVIIKVRPASTHPTFYDIQFGYLCVFVSAANPEEAADKAGIIASTLLYEIVGGKFCVQEPRGSVLSEDDAAHFETMRQVGLSLALHCCPTGTDEGTFANEFGSQDDDYESPAA